MLSRRHRLSRRAFPAHGAGMRAQSEHFSIVGGPGAVEGSGAVVVSKKVARRAVARNLLRRRVLAVMAPLLIPGRFLVVYARSGSPDLPFPIVKKEITMLISRVSGRHP